jgi:hypothetical protein
VALFIIVNFNLKNKEQQRVGWVEERNPTQPTVTFLKVNSTTQLSTKMFQFN